MHKYSHIEETHRRDVEQQEPDTKQCMLLIAKEFIPNQAKLVEDAGSQDITASWEEAVTRKVHMGDLWIRKCINILGAGYKLFLVMKTHQVVTYAMYTFLYIWYN